VKFRDFATTLSLCTQDLYIVFTVLMHYSLVVNDGRHQNQLVTADSVY